MNVFNMQSVKTDIINELFLEYQNTDIKYLSDIIENIEDTIIRHITNNIYEYFSSSIENLVIVKNAQKILVDDVPFELKIGTQDLFYPRNLIVAILPTANEKKKVKIVQKQNKIGGIGKYESYQVMLDNTLSAHLTFVSEIVETVLRVSYKWFTEFIQLKISSIEPEINKLLYSTLRTIFSAESQENLVNNIWLIISHRQHGAFLLDRFSVDRVIKLLNHSNLFPSANPSVMLTSMLTTVLDYDQMHGKEAVKQGRCIDVDLRKSLYLSEHHEFEQIEEIIYNSRYFSVYPIFYEGNAFLFAGFPTNLKNEILHVLEPNKQLLINVFIYHRDNLRRLINKLKAKYSQSSISVTVGQLIGGIIKAITE